MALRTARGCDVAVRDSLRTIYSARSTPASVNRANRVRRHRPHSGAGADMALSVGHRSRFSAQHAMADDAPVRRPILGILSIVLLFILYRVFAVYTVRSGECRPKPVDPSVRILTRDEVGRVVSFPERVGYPRQQHPLVVMTYNIEGHDELYDTDHAAKIAATINQFKPDIVGLQEVHDHTWQVRFRNQYEEIRRLTKMNGYYGRSYRSLGGDFGNAILTRGQVVCAVVHPLPSIGEPRSVLEAVVRIDGATLNVYVARLTAWASLNAKSRG